MAKNDFSIQLSADDSKLISALNNSKQKLQHLESAFQKAGSKSKVFGSSMEGLGGKLEGLSGQFEGLLSKVGGSMESLTGAIGGGVSEMLGSLGVLSGGFAALGAAAVGACAYILKGFDDLKSEMNNFQAVTDVSDEEMKAFEQSARDLSNSTGVAEKSIIALQTSLVGINPQLAQNREALLKSTEAAILLGKAGRISSEEASTALSSILAQYNLAGTESLNVANAIAAGSKAGAIEIQGLGEVMQKAGTTMNSAGLNYAQSVALVESVGDKWINKESELGTHLQSTFSKLQSVRKEWEQFNPAIVGTTQALENMSRAQLKYSDLVELVGLQNAPLLQQLIDARGKYQALQKEVTGTTAAQDMAAKQTDTLSNSWEHVKTTWDNLMTSIAANSAPMKLLYDYVKYVCDAISDLISWAGELVDEWNNLMSGFDSSFTVWDLLKGYIQYTIWLYKAFSEAVIVACAIAIKPIIELWQVCKKFATDIWKRFSDFPLGRAVKNAVIEAWKWLQDLWGKIVKWWNSLKKSLGLKTDNSTDVKLNVKEDRTVTQTFKGGGGSGLPSISSGKKGGKKGGSKKHGSGSKKTGIEEPEIGSLKYFEDKLRQINKELSDTNVSSGRLQELKMEAAVVQEQIDKIKRRNKLFDEKPKHSTQKATVEQGSIQEISDLISSKESQLKNLKVGSGAFNLLVQEIEELKEKKEFLELKMHPKIDENSMNSLLGSLAKVQEQINGLKYEVSITTDKSKLELLREQIDYLTNKEHTIQLKVDEKKQNTIAQNADDIKTKYENLGQAAQSVGNVFSALGDVSNDSFLSMVGTISGAVANILPQIGKLIPAFQAQAVAAGTANAAAVPFPANLIAIASIITSIISVFSSLPKFADGGIVQGKSFGDYNLARVNGGEMILNTTQQGRLWNTIQQGTTSNAPMNGSVQFKISGRDLIGVLSNQQNKTSRVL